MLRKPSTRLGFIALALSLLLGWQDARAQSSSPVQSAASVSTLPAPVAASVRRALQSGNRALITLAINQAVSARPDLAVAIAQFATQTSPSDAGAIAGAATAAIMAFNPAAAGLVLDISRAVTRAAPAFASQVAASVFQNLPRALQDAANRNSVSSAVVGAVAPQAAAETASAVAVALAALSASAPSDVTTPIVFQAPVSGV